MFLIFNIIDICFIIILTVHSHGFPDLDILILKMS